jgi:4-aminobutyrate aminotransferase-like enzyme
VTEHDRFALPALRTAVPGPKSNDLARRLARVESPNITSLAPYPPIFWHEAWNANVADVDGNVFIDLTAGFGVAFAGHANADVSNGVAAQAARLPHAMGDVYPADVKVELLEKIAEITPGELSVSILCSDGANAVEAALKTAVMKTGRAGILAFEGAYHGLSYGALATTWRDDFRSPFLPQLNGHVRFAPYPRGGTDPDEGSFDVALNAVSQILALADADDDPIGAIIVEPIQGRGGIIVPPDEFLQALRDLCDGSNRVLIFDEIYTGMGRTGTWFAAQHSGVLPDIMTIGKALSGALPLSAAVGTPAVMSAWPASEGEAIHTSTFLGNPLGCAAALAQIRAIERDDLVVRASALGVRIGAVTERWVASRLAVARRGAGLLQGVRLARPDLGPRVMRTALERGVLVLPEGDGSVLAITPPATISEDQIDYALGVLEAILEEARGGAYR